MGVSLPTGSKYATLVPLVKDAHYGIDISDKQSK